jgi:predicted nucleic acid-binding protein
VLAEFYSVATSKAKLNMTHDEALVLLRSLARLPVCPITRELVLEATELRQRFAISYWDAAIIAAAKRMGCTTVYSEDLNAGQNYDGVTVTNPFAASTAP